MRIADKKLRNRDRTMYIFEFETEEECRIFFDNLQTMCEECQSHDEDLAREIQELTDALRRRCDDKYACEGCAMSALMFQDEMSRFAIQMYYLSVLFCGQILNMQNTNELQ